MNRLPVFLMCAATLVGLLILPSARPAGQDRRAQGEDAAILSGGKWRGTWLALSPQSGGYVFAADLELRVDGDNAAEGTITWTLRRTPIGSFLAGKVGRTAVEHVQGTYHPATRTLRVDGYRKDDPNQSIAIDKYRLVLAENDRVLGGITECHGTWQGLISLNFQEKD